MRGKIYLMMARPKANMTFGGSLDLKKEEAFPLEFDERFLEIDLSVHSEAIDIIFIDL